MAPGLARAPFGAAEVELREIGRGAPLRSPPIGAAPLPGARSQAVSQRRVEALPCQVPSAQARGTMGSNHEKAAKQHHPDA